MPVAQTISGKATKVAIGANVEDGWKARDVIGEPNLGGGAVESREGEAP